MDEENFERLTQEIKILWEHCYFAGVPPVASTMPAVHAQLNTVLDMMPEYQNREKLTHNPDYHPEGNLNEHLHRMVDVYVSEKYASRGRHPNDPVGSQCRSPQDDFGLHLLYAIIFHDIGKAVTAKENADTPMWHTYYGHDKAGATIVIEDYHNFESTLQTMMVDVCQHHMNFWTVVNERKIQNIARCHHFVLIAHLCRIDKMMSTDTHILRKANGEWMKRCGEMLKAAKSSQREKDTFIQRCYAVMDMFGVDTRWQMVKGGPQALLDPDLPESLGQLLEKIITVQEASE